LVLLNASFMVPYVKGLLWGGLGNVLITLILMGVVRYETFITTLSSQRNPIAIADLTPVISRTDIIHQLLTQLPLNKQPFPIHLKIDTGLHRLGFNAKEALALLTTLSSSTSPITIQGLLTHFADADNPDPSLTNQQLHQFHQPTASPIPSIYEASSRTRYLCSPSPYGE